MLGYRDRLLEIFLLEQLQLVESREHVDQMMKMKQVEELMDHLYE